MKSEGYTTVNGIYANAQISQRKAKADGYDSMRSLMMSG
jgi:hypothetical protein